MKTWPIQDAKARFSEFLDACASQGPQMISHRGTEIAVLVSFAEWKRLQSTARPCLKELLLSNIERTDDLVIIERGKAQRRKAQKFY